MSLLVFMCAWSVFELIVNGIGKIVEVVKAVFEWKYKKNHTKRRKYYA